MRVIGIDEAGRGALAGPVAVGVVSIRKGFYPHSKNLPRLKDSKELTALGREAWFEYIREHEDIFYTVSRVYPRLIDSKNVSWAANRAASLGFNRHLRDFGPDYEEVLLDGSLYLGFREHEDIPSKTIVGGDGKITAIKLASIVAKVTRDRYMQKLALKFPEYGFDIHKGYGTEMHMKNIGEHGPCEAHRQSFRLS